MEIKINPEYLMALTHSIDDCEGGLCPVVLLPLNGRVIGPSDEEMGQQRWVDRDCQVDCEIIVQGCKVNH